MTDQLIVVFIIFLAVFTQSISGFGAPLVAMAFLPAVIGIRVATPLVALVVATIGVFLLVRYRNAFNISAIWRIVLGSLFGIPLGLFFLSRLDEETVMFALGVFIAGYAIHALLDEFSTRIRLPNLENPAWAYVFGLIAGMLGGAYNTSGPPVVVYGNSCRWETTEFKSNLQGFFLLTSFVIVFGHAWNRNLTPEIWLHYFWSIPAMVLGVIIGTSLDKYLKPQTFRRIVLVLLVIMGTWLILS